MYGQFWHRNMYKIVCSLVACAVGAVKIDYSVGPKSFVNRAGRDDVTTGKLFPSRGECLGLNRCVLIIFKRK